MTDLLTGRALDLALAEVTDAPCDRWLQGIGEPCGGQRAKHPTRHEYEPPEFDLPRIAAAEQPLRDAGWEQKITSIKDAYEVEWWAPDAYHDDDPKIYIYTPDEVTARGNALYRGLLKLKEARDAR